MKRPAIHRSAKVERDQRGVTMILVALAMVAIIAMAALSIDVVTLYLAKEEAQRAADAAALAAAKVISLSGVTGDPSNSSSSWQAVCGGASSPANEAANSVGIQMTIGSIPPAVNVTYSAGGGQNSDCSHLNFTNGINNPLVTVQVQRPGLPTFFSRIWGNTGNSVSASATAEVFNPSSSGNMGNSPTGTIIPVQPRCVKPWVVPNRDPMHPGLSHGAYCDTQDPVTHNTTPCDPLVQISDGSIVHPGVSLNGAGSGIIGERFWIEPDCRHTGSTCRTRTIPPQANYYNGSVGAWLELPPSLHYLPGDAPGPTPVAVPSCSSGTAYEEAIEGCDQSTVYQCGVPSNLASPPNRVDLSENPSSGTNDTRNAVKCMIHQANENDTSPDGQDTLDLTTFPFKISSGNSNPLIGSNNLITISPSVVSLPIFDSANNPINGTGTTDITIVGFLQVFINRTDPWGNVDVTVLNVAGCSNGSGGDPVGTALSGSSPVPVRLITAP